MILFWVDDVCHGIVKDRDIVKDISPDFRWGLSKKYEQVKAKLYKENNITRWVEIEI